MAAHTESLKYSLSDGATLGYDIFGLEHLGKGKRPIILVVGRGGLKSDWDYLIPSLSQKRPVLVSDHRGMGDSTLPSLEKDEITLELMARDIVALVEHIGWKDVDILGLSMGGVILQQILLLPSHGTNPTPLPFRVHHGLLMSTLCSPITRPAVPPPSVALSTSGQPPTLEQRKAITRSTLDACFSPKWLALPKNKERYEVWLEHTINTRRPIQTIMKQSEDLMRFNFSEELVKIPPSIKVLVVHGQEDLLLPFSRAEEILRSLPHARIVEIGSRRGQVPSYEFGHLCYEYFEQDVWIGVIEAFVDDEDNS